MPRYHKGTPEAVEMAVLNITAATAGVLLKVFLGMGNVGRGEHTCAYHIDNNYAHLADMTIFIKDTAEAHSHLGIGLRLLAFSRRMPPTDFWCARPPSLVDLSFALPSYKSENCWRFGMCYANESFTLATIRPLGRWLKSLGVEPLGATGFAWVCYGGFFAASRRAMQASPRTLYARLALELSVADSLEAGHYLERAWPSLFRLSHPPRPRFVRVAVYLTACGGQTLPPAFTNLPVEGSRVVADAHGQMPLAYWPGDTCDSLACRHTDMLLPDVRHSLERAAHDMLHFFVFSDSPRELSKAEAHGWWTVLLPPAECLPRELKMLPHRLSALSDFDYTAFVPPDAPAALSIGNILRVVTSELSSLSGASVAIIGKRRTLIQQHPHQKLSSIQTIVRRESTSAHTFGERWHNLSSRRSHTKHDERFTLEDTLRDIGSEAVVLEGLG